MFVHSEGKIFRWKSRIHEPLNTVSFVRPLAAAKYFLASAASESRSWQYFDPDRRWRWLWDIFKIPPLVTILRQDHLNSLFRRGEREFQRCLYTFVESLSKATLIILCGFRIRDHRFSCDSWQNYLYEVNLDQLLLGTQLILELIIIAYKYSNQS